jgi:hypothetical protein
VTSEPGPTSRWTCATEATTSTGRGCNAPCTLSITWVAHCAPCVDKREEERERGGVAHSPWGRVAAQIIAPALEGRDPTQQAELDALMTETLDGTGNLSQLGANAVLAASVAVCKVWGWILLLWLIQRLRPIGLSGRNKENSGCKFRIPEDFFQSRIRAFESGRGADSTLDGLQAGAAELGLPLYRHVGNLAGTASLLPPPSSVALAPEGSAEVPGLSGSFLCGTGRGSASAGFG